MLHIISAKQVMCLFWLAFNALSLSVWLCWDYSKCHDWIFIKCYLLRW